MSNGQISHKPHQRKRIGSKRCENRQYALGASSGASGNLVIAAVPGSLPYAPGRLNERLSGTPEALTSAFPHLHGFTRPFIKPQSAAPPGGARTKYPMLTPATRAALPVHITNADDGFQGLSPNGVKIGGR